MDNKAILNKQEIELSDAEMAKASLFHRNRKAFAILDNKLVFNNKDNDDRDHQHWLKEEYGIDRDTFENIPRGYMRKDRIQLFIGSTFSPISLSDLSIDTIESLLTRHMESYGYCDNLPIYNGAHIGNIGETWEPCECLGLFENRLA